MNAHDAIHLVAIGFTALAVCVHSGWRSRPSSLGLIAAILMLAAMVDVAFTNLLSIVIWIPALLAAAIGLAASRSVRRRSATARAHAGAWISSHDALGLVATAALLPLMHVGAATEGYHAGHGAPMGVLIALVLIIAGLHALGSFLACVRKSGTVGRVQLAAMGLSTCFMALSVAHGSTVAAVVATQS